VGGVTKRGEVMLTRNRNRKKGAAQGNELLHKKKRGARTMITKGTPGRNTLQKRGTQGGPGKRGADQSPGRFTKGMQENAGDKRL